MTAGQFINLPLLHKHYGKSRVVQTGIRLRAIGMFAKGNEAVFPEQVAIFLYCLFSTSSSIDVDKALESMRSLNGSPYAAVFVPFFASLFAERKIQKVDYVTFSTLNGSAKFFFKDGQVVHFQKPDFNLNHLGEDVEVDELDFLTKVGQNFLLKISDQVWPSFLPSDYEVPE